MAKWLDLQAVAAPRSRRREFVRKHVAGKPRLGLKPVAAVRDPPAHDENGDGGGQGPPERQHETNDHIKRREDDPEDFSLHEDIVGVQHYSDTVPKA